MTGQDFPRNPEELNKTGGMDQVNETRMGRMDQVKTTEVTTKDTSPKLYREFGSGFLRGTHQGAVTESVDMEDVISDQNTRVELNKPAGLTDSQIKALIVRQLIY